MEGILLIIKPSGWTSFDVVAKVRGILKGSGIKKPKIGHTGTLDPLATGLLVLLIGSYTKKAETLSKLDKVYEGTMYLGQASTTGDGEGEKTAVSDRQPTKTEIQAAMESFTGQIDQVPPAYSAIKINGERAYKLARSGVTPHMEARSVHIYSIELKDYTYPEVRFVTKVSSGTYIRSLVSDMGETLGTGAYMSDLNRSQIGEFSIKDAVNIDGLTAEKIHQHLIDIK